MQSEILAEIRKSSPNLKNSIISRLELYGARRVFCVFMVTDTAYTPEDKEGAIKIIKNYVPPYFACRLEISKLSPDCEMVEHKIEEAIKSISMAVSSTISDGDIKVEKCENGFFYTVSVLQSFSDSGLCEKINAYLKKSFCGEFNGKCVETQTDFGALEIDNTENEAEYEVPVRTFKIAGFEFLEGDKIRDTAVYLGDLNFASDEVVICGVIDDIRERSYTNKNGDSKNYLSLVLNDGSGTAYVTYFIRKKSEEKIRALKVGDSIVCTGTNEIFKGNLRYTAKTVDRGTVPEGFVPEKRTSKPVPHNYRFVMPEPYSDAEQTDMFTQNVVPECLKGRTFVVLDLETTGLNSSPVAGNMDKIIEIGAYKIADGEIKESFSTFVNPERKLSAEIVSLTGITEEMVLSAPKYEEVMPDFFKFCSGSVLVGHNITGFDFKFIDYYFTRLGYIIDRKLIDTIALAQEQVTGLSNYKLNTLADRFGITFNHHRAVDDALATAKIFIELIKLKKSLPKF